MATKGNIIQRGDCHLLNFKNENLNFHFIFQIINYFDKGKCWEKGIPLCKELAYFYETNRFDYNRLSHILMTESKFFQNILTQLRPEPEYFRVGFYGMGMPLFVRVSICIIYYVSMFTGLKHF